MLNRLTRAVRDPASTALRLRSMVDPDGLMRQYSRLARAAGLDKLYFILSFDCDTQEDFAVVEQVHTRLNEMGLMPVYAVPGALLERGEKHYRRVHETGAEFINHGYIDHTFFDEAKNEYASCFFYDQQTRERIRQDITEGDACLKRVLGITPQGFRTPHFGTFQKPDDLAFLHGVLSDLGYRFSTSTTPVYGFRFGPIFDRFGITELPVSGMGTAPLAILDSWGCFAAPGRRLSGEDYLREGILAARKHAANNAGVMNFYADPSHIHDQELFFDTVREWLAVAEPISYRDLLARCDMRPDE